MAYNKISEEDVRMALFHRVSLNINELPRVVSYSEIDIPINLTEILLHNTGIFIAELRFVQCKFNCIVDVGSYQQAGNIVFKNCIFEAKVTVATTANVEFDDCSFKNDLIISQITQLEFGNITIEGNLWVSGNSGQSLKLENIIVSNNKKVTLAISNAGLRLEKCDFPKLQITGLTKVDGHLVIEKSKIGQIEFLSSKIEIGLHISNSEVGIFRINHNGRISEEFKVEDSKIADMEYPLSTFQEASISNSAVELLRFTKTNRKEDILILEKLNIGSLIFDNILNEGLFSLREVHISTEGKICVTSSNLGKMDFILCNFKSAQLEFENSKMTEVFGSETEFPKTVFSKNGVNHGQAQLAFGQIGAAFQKQGDTVRALEYQSREIEAHYNSLKLCSKDFFKVFNLWLNKWSNNFGRYWMRGVLFSFGIGLLLFSALLISTTEYRLGYPHIDWRLLPAYLKFMNPLRFFELEQLFKPMPGEIALNEWSYFWDFLGRVFIAYGFYQTIQAFRRYGRK